MGSTGVMQRCATVVVNAVDGVWEFRAEQCDKRCSRIDGCEMQGTLAIVIHRYTKVIGAWAIDLIVRVLLS